MELGLGTAQFGFDYGLSNTSGKVPFEKVRAILDSALENGIRVIDTAFDYQDSERVLGETLPGNHDFRIITKLPALKKKFVTNQDTASSEKAFRISLKHLKAERIEGLLMHYPGDLLVPGGEKLYSLMRSLKAAGVVGKIGISVYDGSEIDRLFHYYDFDLVQLPLNVFDQRLIQSGHVGKLNKRGIEVHVRSAFLQGLLLMPLGDIDRYFSPILPLIKRYLSFLNINGLTACEGALGFLRRQEGIDVILTGVTGERELKENCEALCMKLPLSVDYSGFSVTREDMIDPRLWKMYDSP